MAVPSYFSPKVNKGSIFFASWSTLVICSFSRWLFCLFNLYADYIMRNTGLDEAQAGIKIARRNINNLRLADDTTLMA